MAESSGFFRSVSGDRKYTVDFLSKWTASFLSNGVYKTDLAVTADENMQVIIPSGQAWINGYYYRNDSPLTLTLANADGVLHRKDTVILRWDINTRSITVQVLQGAPSSTPAAPAIVRTAEQYDLKLAEISVPAGTTAITQALITDTRLDNSVCGIVHAVVDNLDMTTFYKQIAADLAEFKSKNEAEFAEWFEGIKKILDENAAGHLQNEIDAILAAKGQPNGFATLDEYGHIPKEQINMPEPTYSGKLVVHVTRYDGGEIGTTKVRIQNTALGMDLSYTPDALGNVTLHLSGNKTYSISLVNVPDPYYGEAATQYIGFDTENELTLQVKDQPDIIGFQINLSTGAVDYTDGAADWTPMSMNGSTLEPGSFENSWLVKDVRPCLLKNGVVQYYLKKLDGFMMFDYDHKENGDPSDITTGNDGDVMIEIPKVYMQSTIETVLGVNYLHVRFTKQSLSNYILPPYVFGNPARDSVYYAAYKPWLASSSSSPMSISGQTPVSYTTVISSSNDPIPELTLKIRKYIGIFELASYDLIFLYLLYIMLFKTHDLSKFGYSGSGTHSNGLHNSRALCYMSTSAFKFLGIEDPFFNITLIPYSTNDKMMINDGYAANHLHFASFGLLGADVAYDSTIDSSSSYYFFDFIGNNGLIAPQIVVEASQQQAGTRFCIKFRTFFSKMSNAYRLGLFVSTVHSGDPNLVFDVQNYYETKIATSDGHVTSVTYSPVTAYLCFKYLEPIS